MIGLEHEGYWVIPEIIRKTKVARSCKPANCRDPGMGSGRRAAAYVGKVMTPRLLG